MAREHLEEAVKAEDVIFACGGVPNQPSSALEDYSSHLIWEDCSSQLGHWEETREFKPQKLPIWLRIIALFAALIAVASFVNAIGVTDLTSLILESGVTTPALEQVRLYAILIVALFVLALAIGRRSKLPVIIQTPREKRKLTKRTLVAAVMVMLLIPLTLFISVYYLDNKKYYFTALLVLLECMLPFFLVFEGRKPKARELVVIAVLCAIGVAGRAAFFMLPQFKPVMASTIIAGVAFGGETGFLVGAITMLASNVMFSQCPWTPWQMFRTGIIGFLAGILFRKGLLRRGRGSLCVFGALSAIIIYGGIINPASALMFSNSLSWKIILSYYISGFFMDFIHAAATAIFLWFAAEPMLEKLDRIKVKYALVE